MQDVKQIRNAVILGHGNSGKTTLAEALMYNAGVVNRLGKVDDGTAAMDFEPEETKRKITIGASVAHVPWKKKDLFLIDTPGDDNFVNETANAVQVADSAVLTIGAVLGVRNQTERFVDYVLAKRLPRLIAITKMDRERANFTKTINEIRDNFSLTPVVIHAPIGEEQDFRGVVDLVDNKAWFFAADNSGKVEPGEIPHDLADELQGMRESLMEQVAETDDDLIEVFLEEGELTVEQLKEGLVKAVHAGKVTPVSACSALNNKGATFILDAITDLLPSPDQCPAWMGSDPKTEEPVERKGLVQEPFSALVFKTMADPFAGRLTLFRVCSGTLAGDDFYNASKDVSERHGNLYIMKGKEQVQVE
ncbi:MAG: GTP-binding protein, partial [Desulfobulbaceae bacterium]|nr:GTP-binding protein [Desulfobulbaceae bacterium]